MYGYARYARRRQRGHAPSSDKGCSRRRACGSGGESCEAGSGREGASVLWAEMPYGRCAGRRAARQLKRLYIASAIRPTPQGNPMRSYSSSRLNEAHWSERETTRFCRCFYKVPRRATLQVASKQVYPAFDLRSMHFARLSRNLRCVENESNQWGALTSPAACAAQHPSRAHDIHNTHRSLRDYHGRCDRNPGGAAPCAACGASAHTLGREERCR